MSKKDTLIAYLLRLGDNALVLGQRLTEIVAAGPELEEELANANIALDYLGQARMFYAYAGELEGKDVGELPRFLDTCSEAKPRVMDEFLERCPRALLTRVASATSTEARWKDFLERLEALGPIVLRLGDVGFLGEAHVLDRDLRLLRTLVREIGVHRRPVGPGDPHRLVFRDLVNVDVGLGQPLPSCPPVLPGVEEGGDRNADRLALVGARDREGAVGELDVGLRGLEQMGGDLLGFCDGLVAGHDDGRAADRQRAGAVGAVAPLHLAGIAVHYVNVFDRDTEPVGDQLREGGLVALALGLRARQDRDGARGAEADLGAFVEANAGADGAVVLDKVKNGKAAFGFNAATGEFEDLIKAGIVDPTKVVRCALQNAASVAGLLITTEVMIAEKPEKKKEAPHMHPDEY